MATAAVDDRAGNLPAEVSKFIGRRRELAEARRLLAASRLVTMVGVSGVGKTRLALRIAADVRRSFAGGAWFVELSEVRDGDMVARTVAETLRLSGQSAREQIDLLADYLENRHLLLVLDTCEHLIAECAILAEVLLRAAPRLRILATSREPFDVPGEHTLVIPPLSVPDPDGPISGATTAQFEALALFVDRAAAVVPGFTIAERNQRAVARLCQRLDGLPLAIELAAGRLRSLSVEQIVERLDDRFRLLGGNRTSLTRHQTLRAAVGWSHELCTSNERLLWARLSVFAGSFDLEAAQHVCASDQLPPEEVFDSLARLVEKSIILREEHSYGVRYRLLDTLREYGAEWLDHQGQTRELRRRHQAWFVGLAASAMAQSAGAAQVDWLARLRREHANLRAALEFSVSTPGEGEAAVSMVAALSHYWLAAGHFSEGRRWIGRALAVGGEQSVDRCFALCVAALLAAMQGDVTVCAASHAEALALAERLDDPRMLTYATRLSGVIAFFGNDLDRTRDILEKPPIWMGGPDFWMILRLPLLAAACVLAGDLERAIKLCAECQEICEARKERWCLSYALWVRGLVWVVQGDPGTADGYVRDSLRIRRDLNDQLGIAMSCDLLAGCAGFTGEHRRAARLFGAADQMWRNLGIPRVGPGYSVLLNVTVESIREAMGAAAYDAAAREGARLADPVAYALEEADEQAEPPAARAGWAPLTRREREIAELIAEGLPNREIAERLLIAKRTVDSHMEHILAKLGFSGRAQVAVWVAERRSPGAGP